MLVDLQKKVGELFFHINSRPAVIILQNTLNQSTQTMWWLW
jgi:hypothetical protein